MKVFFFILYFVYLIWTLVADPPESTQQWVAVILVPVAACLGLYFFYSRLIGAYKNTSKKNHKNK